MTRSSPSPDWIPVASFVPTNVDAKAIGQTLQEAKVSFRTEGSRAVQILVAHEDTRRAVNALERSPAASRIRFYAID